jgi:hypothetical protein
MNAMANKLGLRPSGSKNPRVIGKQESNTVGLSVKRIALPVNGGQHL